MAKITYTNKVALNENPEIALINKVTDDDLNQIKSVVNTNDDNVGDLTTLTTTTKTSTVAAINELQSNKAENDIVEISNTQPSSTSNKIWIDTGEIGSAVSEITNEYSTSTGIGYSANYTNNLHTYSNDEIRVGTWLGKPLYRKVIEVSGVSTDISHNITNLSKVVRAYGYFTRTFQNVLSQTIPHTDTDTTYVVDFNFFDTTKIYMIIGSNITSTISGMVLVLEYIKTTD